MIYMYEIIVRFIGLGANEGVNEELRKIVLNYQAALEFLQSISTRISADRKLASVSIELADKLKTA